VFVFVCVIVGSGRDRGWQVALADGFASLARSPAATHLLPVLASAGAPAIIPNINTRPGPSHNRACLQCCRLNKHRWHLAHRTRAHRVSLNSHKELCMKQIAVSVIGSMPPLLMQLLSLALGTEESWSEISSCVVVQVHVRVCM
jgi:hypothetical protein